MTRTEIERQALGLPAAERAVLLKALRESLLAEGQLPPEEQQAMRELRTQFEIQLAAGFASGTGRVWNEEDWAALKRGEYKHPLEEDSWATPPGWKASSPRQAG